MQFSRYTYKRFVRVLFFRVKKNNIHRSLNTLSVSFIFIYILHIYSDAAEYSQMSNLITPSGLLDLHIISEIFESETLVNYILPFRGTSSID